MSERAFAAACDVLRVEMDGVRAKVIDELFRLHRQQPITLEYDVADWVDDMMRCGKIVAIDRAIFLDVADRVVWELRHAMK